MKNLLVLLIGILAGGLVSYFIFSGPGEATKKNNTANTEKTLVWPNSRDTVPINISGIKEKFVALSDTSTTLPYFDSTTNLFLASTYARLSPLPPDRVDVTLARDEIRDYINSNNPDEVRTVWININDIMQVLGVSPRVGNPYNYDGFRIYMAKARNHPRPEAEGKTTLVLVATENNGGVHQDIVTGTKFQGVYNKFDPCPPPTSCPGTVLSPIQ